MSSGFPPHLDILPREQGVLWPQLRPLAAMGFVLYGGTALALRTGHRVSVDFDFFSNPPLDRRRLWEALPALAAGTLLQEAPDAITSLVRPEPSTEATVKLSLFGGLELGRVGESSWTEDCVARGDPAAG